MVVSYGGGYGGGLGDGYDVSGVCIGSSVAQLSRELAFAKVVGGLACVVSALPPSSLLFYPSLLPVTLVTALGTAVATAVATVVATVVATPGGYGGGYSRWLRQRLRWRLWPGIRRRHRELEQLDFLWTP
ncbi:hypothetical protein MRX96_001471 [Rhipicephalus microplus]